MKKIACLAVLAAILPVSAWAECTYPKKPGNPPNGNRATRTEMTAAITVNNQYQAAINAYLQCLKSEHLDALAKNTTATEDQKKKMNSTWEKKNDAAVDEAQQVADRINEQIRLCKARADNCKK